MADLEQRVYQLEERLRYAGGFTPNRGHEEWVCKIKTNFKTYVEVGRPLIQVRSVITRRFLFLFKGSIE